ncbi:hypothetical protein XELAEV_18014915mg [Xenopus laevis]|uniref:Uncharacterized protein n=1 Tax=Xenopus laevis TaxID=8355 RepID=A0A974DJQ5_XENLA|nr:hypothetical protein XELAEV_18014915mg [Xenopus laevis]
MSHCTRAPCSPGLALHVLRRVAQPTTANCCISYPIECNATLLPYCPYYEYCINVPLLDIFLLLLLLLSVHHCHDNCPLFLRQMAQIGQILGGTVGARRPH